MSGEKHTTLKEAIKDKDKLKKFIEEREQENPGDEAVLDKTIESFTSQGSQKKKSTPETSAPDSSEN